MAPMVHSFPAAALNTGNMLYTPDCTAYLLPLPYLKIDANKN